MALIGRSNVIDSVADNAHDLIRSVQEPDGDMPANWIFAGEKLVREFLADNQVSVVIKAFLIGEEPAGDQRYLHGGEIAGIGGAIVCLVLELKAARRVLGKGKDEVASIACTRRRGDKARRDDSGQTAHALQKRLVEGDDLLPGVILLFG